MSLVLVRGTSDVASAIAVALFRAGHRVVVHDGPAPAHARRGAAFVDALFDGKVSLEGTLAKYAPSLDSVRRMIACRRAVPVVDTEFGSLVRALRPDVLVDARMQKREHPAPQRGLVPLTIGLGPNFVAGQTADLVVETAYGENLGMVIRTGSALPLAGEPRTLGGHGRERFIYAPVAGTFRTQFVIGSAVVAGQPIAQINDTPLHAPLTGRLRGLVHDGAEVEFGAKVIEVDASGEDSSIYTLGERPKRIAEGVLVAVSGAIARRSRLNAMLRAHPFGLGALVGTLGGLIGLGGAEFRLPALVSLFRFQLREAIAINLLTSLVTVVFALAFRVLGQGTQAIGMHVVPMLGLLTGSIAGAFIGARLITRLSTAALHRIVSGLLVAMALLVAWHGLQFPTASFASNTGVAALSLGLIAGLPIGCVSSMLGVAGGELLIPTLVLLYGVDIKLAGTLSLMISIPMLLVSILRLWHMPPMRAVVGNRQFLAWLALGSVVGAYLGTRLLGVIPVTGLSLLLGAVLLFSAIKLFRT